MYNHVDELWIRAHLYICYYYYKFSSGKLTIYYLFSGTIMVLFSLINTYVLSKNRDSWLYMYALLAIRVVTTTNLAISTFSIVLLYKCNWFTLSSGKSMWNFGCWWDDDTNICKRVRMTTWMDGYSWYDNLKFWYHL